MAKSMNFFGQKSGSTKSLTFQIRDGKQIVKDRVWKVRNPRSEGQMEQRCRVATVAQAYRNMREIVDHSFEGMSGKAKNYARFSKLGLAAMKQNLANFAYAWWGDKKFHPGAYVMSEGSLDPIQAFTAQISDGNLILKSNILGGTATEAEICAALGLERIGDMVTICVVAPSELSAYMFFYIRAKLVSTPKSTALAADAQMSCLEFQATNGVAFSGLKYTATIANIHYVVTAAPNWYITPGAGYTGNCVIRSRKENDQWVYSPATLIMGEDFAQATLNDFQTAVATYPTGESLILQGGGSSVQ